MLNLELRAYTLTNAARLEETNITPGMTQEAFPHNNLIGLIIPIVQMRKLRHREVK